MPGKSKTKKTTNDLLMERPGFMFRRCFQVSGNFQRIGRALGITADQYDVLFVLHHEKNIDQDAMAILLGLDRATTGLVVRNLEKKELLTRKVKAEDRRKLNLKMTAKGRKVFKKAQVKAEETKEMILAPLSTKERREFFSYMRRIVNAPKEVQ